MFYVARDLDRTLCLYDAKPVRREALEMFVPQIGYESLVIEEDMFPEVTWENSPQEIEFKLVKEFKKQ